MRIKKTLPSCYPFQLLTETSDNVHHQPWNSSLISKPLYRGCWIAKKKHRPQPSEFPTGSQLSSYHYVQMRRTVAHTTAPRTITFSSLSSLPTCKSEPFIPSKFQMPNKPSKTTQGRLISLTLPVELLHDRVCIHGCCRAAVELVLSKLTRKEEEQLSTTANCSKHMEKQCFSEGFCMCSTSSWSQI